MNLTERVALVTGASSGIGLAVARVFVARGMRVALVARTQARLEEAVRELGPDRAAAFALDVRDRVATAGLPARVLERFHRLDVVVHNAGVNHRGIVAEKSPEELSSIIETNLLSPMLLTRAVLPHLTRGAAIVCVASLAGKVPVPHEAAYSASKAGLRAFARALRVELGEIGINVSTVCPGPVDTGFLGDTKDVPDLVFSQPMSTAESVADAVVAAIETGRAEIDVPALSGKLATLGYLSPGVFAKLRPLLEKRGARNKQRYLDRGRART